MTDINTASLFRVGGDDSTDLSTDFKNALTARFGTGGDEPVGGPADPPTDAPPEAPDAGSGTAESGPADDAVSPPEPAPEPALGTPVEPPTPTDLPPAAEIQIVEGDSELPVADTSTPGTPPAPDAIDYNDLFTRFTGSPPTAQQVTNLLQFVATVSSLPPDRAAQLQQVLYGDAPSSPQPATTPSTPIPTPTSTPAVLLPDDLAPDARALLEPLVNEISTLRDSFAQQQQQTYQAQAQQQQQWIQAQAAEASQDFISSHPELTPTDCILIETRAGSSGHFPLYLQQHNNDPRAAYKALLEATALSDDATRARMIQAQASTAAATQATDDARKTRAASVSAGGTVSPTSTTISPKRQLTPQEWKAAAAADLAAATGMPTLTPGAVPPS